MEDLDKIIGKIVKEVSPIVDNYGEIWGVKIIFTDDTSFNTYMCTNSGNYFDFDYNINL